MGQGEPTAFSQLHNALNPETEYESSLHGGRGELVPGNYACPPGPQRPMQLKTLPVMLDIVQDDCHDLLTCHCG